MFFTLNSVPYLCMYMYLRIYVEEYLVYQETK